MSDKRRYMALDLVSHEIQETLNQSLVDLAGFIENPSDTTKLRFALTYLHQVAGTLTMIEYHGAALLAKEIEGLFDFILINNPSKASLQNIMNTAKQCINDLSVHILKVIETGDEASEALLEPLNLIRKISKNTEEEFTLSDFFNPEIEPKKIELSAKPSVNSEEFPIIVKKLRIHFQRSLLALLNNNEIGKNIALVHKLVEALCKSSKATPNEAFWQVALGVTDVLQHSNEALSLDNKKALRLIDSQFKLLEELGVKGLYQSCDEQKFKSLLYFIATTEEPTDKVRELRKTYNLANALLPKQNDVASIKSVSHGFQSLFELTHEDFVAAQQSIVDYMAQNLDAQHIAHIPVLFTELSSRFSEEPFSRLQPLCLAISDIVRRQCEMKSEPDTWPEVDLVADIISSVNYYLECIKREETKNLQGILDKATETLSKLHYTKDDGGFVFRGEPESLKVELTEKSQGDLQPLLVPVDIDEDIFDIFLEEAGEVTEELYALLPTLQMNPSDAPMLADVRRAWHTLKGSSRMVGADQLGEYAWAIENMLNEIMSTDNTLTDKHFSILQNAMEQLPGLVKALAQKSSINPNLLSSIIYRAQHYAEQPRVDTSEPVRFSEDLKLISVSVEDSLPSMEEETEVSKELQSIFLEEADTHLGVFIDFLALIDEQQDIKVSDDLQRALHTLKGSSHMAGVLPVAKLVTPLESLIMQLSYFRLSLDQETLQLLMRSADELTYTLSTIKEGGLCESTRLDSLISELTEMQSRNKFTGKTSGKNHYQVLLQAGIEHLGVASDQFSAAQKEIFDSHHQDKIIEAMNALSEAAESCGVPAIAIFTSTLSEFYQQIHSAQIFDENVDLAVEAHDMLEDMFDVFAAHQSPVLNEEFLTKLKPKDKTESIHVDKSYGVDDAVIQDIKNADQDILVLFSVEASTLQKSINGLYRAASVGENLTALKHALNTLNGGARLAQLPSIANIALEFEQQLEQAKTKDDVNTSCYDQLAASLQQINLAIDHLIKFVSTQLSDTNVVEKDATAESLLPETEESSTQQNPLSTASKVFQLDWKKLADECEQADAETLVFFIEEAEELVGQLDDSLQQWHEQTKSIEHCAAVKRILHTLKGGARLTELSVFGDFTHEFESMIEVREFDHSFDDDFFALLPKYFDTLQKILDVIIQGGVIPDFTDTAFSEADTVVMAPAFIGHHDPIDVSTLDADLVILFIEEAEEQFETIDMSLSEVHEGNGQQAIEQLKRALHTLKGGARLTGVTGIANISHDFETFVIQFERQAKFDDSFVKGVQQYQEELGDSIAQIKDAVKFTQSNTVQEDIITSKASDQLTQTAIDATQNFFEQLNKKGKNQKSEPIKISANLLENLINLAGESSIGRSRVEEQVSNINFSVDEMDATVDRLHGQLRRLEIETEAQISFRQEQVVSEGQENFDPLEMDRYTHMQQLSKSLIESASDLDDISETIDDKMRDLETLIVQQSRLNSEMQEGLMRAQMVPFSRMVPRLKRIIRQTATELNKKVFFSVDNAEGEMDRSILEKMIAPLEHMLRNAVDHGIESPETRERKGKDPKGKITLSLTRDGGEILLRLSDDGGGINLEAVRASAEQRGLLKPNTQISDHEICQFILHPGFSTAKKVTQISGRGVGMDVVNSEIKQLGGSVEINSTAQGSEFLIRLPFTVSVNRALMVCIGHDTLAIPLNTIEGIVRISPFELENYYKPGAPLFNYAGQSYHLRYLGSLLDKGQRVHLDRIDQSVPVVLIRSNEYSFAVQVDRLLGSQEIVVKSLGPQFSMVEGLSGATVLGDGSVVIILDMASLIRSDISKDLSEAATGEYSQEAHTNDVENALSVMVVDDSVTVRKVTSRFLERMGMTVTLAKDGLHAINQLQEMDDLPDVMLLDIEMPRMDGFEVISRLRRSDRLQHIPICMITSRTGEKHRQRALSLGANEYLGKPFQESILLETIQTLTEPAMV